MQADTTKARQVTQSPYDAALAKYEAAVHDHAAHSKARDDCAEASMRAREAAEISRIEFDKSEDRLKTAQLELTRQIIAKNGH